MTPRQNSSASRVVRLEPLQSAHRRHWQLSQGHSAPENTVSGSLIAPVLAETDQVVAVGAIPVQQYTTALSSVCPSGAMIGPVRCLPHQVLLHFVKLRGMREAFALAYHTCRVKPALAVLAAAWSFTDRPGNATAGRTRPAHSPNPMRWPWSLAMPFEQRNRVAILDEAA